MSRRSRKVKRVDTPPTADISLAVVRATDYEATMMQVYECSCFGSLVGGDMTRSEGDKTWVTVAMPRADRSRVLWQQRAVCNLVWDTQHLRAPGPPLDIQAPLDVLQLYCRTGPGGYTHTGVPYKATHERDTYRLTNASKQAAPPRA